MFKPKNLLNYIVKNIAGIHKGRYFYPFIITVGFCLISLAILYVGSAPYPSKLKEGNISARTIYAPYDFTYPTTIDEKETEEARRISEEKIALVYDIDVSVQKKAFAGLDSFFDNVEKIRQNPDLNDTEKAETLSAKIDFVFSDKHLQRFLESKDLEKIRKISKDALENIFLIGVVGIEERDDLLKKDAKKILIRNPIFMIERELEAKNLVDEKEASLIVHDTLERMLPKDKPMRNAVYDLIKNAVAVNAGFNAKETSDRKETARNQILPIYRRDTVKKNELIIEKGQRLTKEDITKLTQITHIHFIANRAAYISGLFILLAGLVLIVAIYLMLYEKKLIEMPKNVLLITINAFLAILISLIIIRLQHPGYLIPLASIAMLLTLLLNANAAFITSLALSIYVGIMAGGKLGLSFMFFIGSIMSIYIVRGARRRSQIFLAGGVVSLMNFFSIIGMGLLNNLQKETILREGAFGIANGILSSFIVIGSLPLFEYTFNFITNITLLELSDLSHPLLKELTIKAPGTYHHSILVGNLAEDACDVIGANSLLARVGAYYHDIGKTEKAEYFVENEMGIPSKHGKLAPSMSALIITNHSKDGVELAKKYKLNKAIIDFISQHHGTSLIYYFYQRALEKVKSEKELKEEEFRYPGPKPQTKETAVVLLADSVEASSRMLSDPTPARIRGLVQKIINNKFIDGQLDECDLTLKDLNKISESFVRVLTGVFHTRLEYPEGRSPKKRRNAAKNRNK
ncbi:MAG: HDIG domain-containing protein [Candidatus Omnitrophota bacterium]|nr:MAG: HDIG domain-containing protein [Candidatus Omnitrophota bacterium]